MNGGFDFERLVELCQRTHEETRRSAVRAIDLSLVVPVFDKRRTVCSVSATEEIRQTLFSELPVSTGGESEASVPALFLQRLPLTPIAEEGAGWGSRRATSRGRRTRSS